MAQETISIAEYRKYKNIGRGQVPRRVPGKMSKPEAAFSEFAELHKLGGFILDWWFEAVTLRLADTLRYTCDFMILELDKSLSLIEVKTSFLNKQGKIQVAGWDDSTAKLKMAAQSFPFRFKLAVLQPDKTWNIKEI